MTEADVTAAALREARTPSLGVSRQFFGLHALADDPVALVEREEPGRWAVTLRLRGVTYRWRCHVEGPRGVPTPAWSESVEDARVSLNLHSDRLTPGQIADRIGVAPTRSRLLGDPIGRTGRMAEAHGFALDAPAPQAAGLDRQLGALLDLLGAREQAVADTVAACGGGVVTVAYTAWRSQMWGVALEPEQTALLGRLGLGLDVDLYAEGPAL